MHESSELLEINFFLLNLMLPYFDITSVAVPVRPYFNSFFISFLIFITWGQRQFSILLSSQHLAPGLCLFWVRFSRCLIFHFLFFCFLGLHPRHMEVPRLGVESGLQLLAYTTAIRMPDPSLWPTHSLWQCWILNPMSEAGDSTCILMDITETYWAKMGTLWRLSL